MVEIRLKKRHKKGKVEEISGIRLQKKARTKAEVFFPDDIIIDVLSRLPAEIAFRCRLVCRRWRDLTSTHSFKELQMRSSIPMVLVAMEGAISKSFLVDKWSEPKRRRLVYHRFEVESNDTGHNDYVGKFSHGGLVVFEGLMSLQRPEVIILNPTSHKNVKITLSKDLRFSMIFGVFFNPTLEEYCTLWGLYSRGEVYYKMLNLGSNPRWRDISNPWRRRIKFGRMSPVLIGERLYWRVSSGEPCPRTCEGYIMEFDTRSEKFDMMHCPVTFDVECACLSEINLLDIDGFLSLVVTSANHGVVNVSIWKLKDRAQQLWLPMNYTIKDCLIYITPIATVVVGGELVLWSGGRLYVCNLELGSTRIFLKEDLGRVRTFSHVMSLASLKHCKSKIFMNKEGEVVEESDMA